MKSRLLFFVLLGAVAHAVRAGGQQAEAEPDLPTLRRAYEDVLRSIREDRQGKLDVLLQERLAQLDRVRQQCLTSGDLSGAAQTKNEIARVSEAGHAPLLETPGLIWWLVQLRQSHTQAVEKVNADAEAETRLMRQRYLHNLGVLEGRMTRRGDLRGAREASAEAARLSGTAKPDVPMPAESDSGDPDFAIFPPVVRGAQVRIEGRSGSVDGIPAWDWGDGAETRSAFPATHTYRRSGLYTVTLTVRVRNGPRIRREKRDILVLIPAPDEEPNIHSLRISPALVEQRTATVNGYVHYAPRRIQWNWGDGAIDQHAPFPARHQYEDAGSYLLQVATFDDDGRVSLEYQEIRIE